MRAFRIPTLLVVALVATTFAAPAQAAKKPRCFGKRATIVGTPGRDRIKGTSGPDVIVSLGGRDVVNGRGGDDRICTGRGADLVRGGGGFDRLNGGKGSDFVFGGPGGGTIVGAKGFDLVIGGTGNELLFGGPGQDLLIGLAGDDLYHGGGGPFDVASFASSLAGITVDLNVAGPQVTGEGTDTLLEIEGVEGSPLSDTITGQDLPTETGSGLFGLEGNDVLSGLAGNDVILGMDGDDDLSGGTGDDILDGGPSDTGPPKGDRADGGDHLSGDICVSVEDAATTGCELFFRAGRRPASGWLGWLDRLASS